MLNFRGQIQNNARINLQSLCRLNLALDVIVAVV